MKGEFDKAIADYTEAIRMNPQSAEAYRGRGHVYGVKCDFDKSISDFTESIRLIHDLPESILVAAMLILRMVSSTKPSRTTTRSSDS